MREREVDDVIAETMGKVGGAAAVIKVIRNG